MTGRLFEVSILFLFQTCFMSSQAVNKGQQFVKFAGNGHFFNSVPGSAGRMVLCARACMRDQPLCIGIKFSEEQKICELLDTVVPASSPSEDSNHIWVTGISKF